MKTKSLIAGMLLVATTLARAATNDLTSALQKGLFEEEANHNLDAAAQAYQAVSARFDQDRKLAATAIFRLGEVYRKQGRTNEATAQYERIVREFSDQQTLVTLSRQNLAGPGEKKEMPASSPLTRAARLEQKRLLEEEMKLVEQDLADLRKQLANGVVPQSEVRAKEREVLKLRQQVAALDVDATDLAADATAAPVTDDEEKEIRRIQEIIRNSPDLINAPGSGAGITPLCNAALLGQLRVAKFLLDAGAVVDLPSSGSSPIHNAAAAGHKAMVELLLDRGADVNARDSSGRMPIHLAAESGFQSVVETLLTRKADVNAQANKQQTPLFLAAAKGHSAMVDLLIAKGAQLDAKDAKGWTALTAAALEGNTLVVKRLLDTRADPNIPDGSGRTALSYAVQRGHADVVKPLLEGKADPNAGSMDSPLLLAVRADNAALAESLLRAGADPNQLTDCPNTVFQGGTRQTYGNRVKRTSLQAAVLEQYPAMAKLLLQFKGDAKAKNDSGQPLVLDALNNAEILKALLEAGADANVSYGQGPHALIVAAGSDNSAGVELLVKHGADVNVRDDQGRTALEIAAERNGKKSVELLLDAKADANAVVTGSLLTALHRAANNGSGEIAEMLLAHGANPNLKDNTGSTPLHWALGIGRRGIGAQKMVELLLSKGADPNLRNNDGRTALDLAKGVPTPGSGGSGGFAPFTPIPTRAVRQSGVSATPANTEPADLATLLREHGALDDLPDFTAIRITRQEWERPYIVFGADTNGWNRFTLLETVMNFYGQSQVIMGGMSSPPMNWLPFPDFTRLIIRRPSRAPAGKEKEIKVNLLNISNRVDCANDVPLEFGDVVEIPERIHALNELPGNALNALEASPDMLPRIVAPGAFTSDSTNARVRCLYKSVKLVILGQATPMTVFAPKEGWLTSLLQKPEARSVLRSSSDLSRVKVERKDPATAKRVELIVNVAKTPLPQDLWLRDGDVIEVPDKP